VLIVLMVGAVLVIRAMVGRRRIAPGPLPVDTG
jgi:hypothetical protein